jgi:hypothetical protein
VRWVLKRSAGLTKAFIRYIEVVLILLTLTNHTLLVRKLGRRPRLGFFFFLSVNCFQKVILDCNLVSLRPSISFDLVNLILNGLESAHNLTHGIWSYCLVGMLLSVLYFSL